jgi:glycosyltransferase involved in cell wall biosynthesis
MTRIALLCSEPIRARMAGIGIRYLEFARRLPRPGLEVMLVAPPAPAGADALAVDTLVPFERGRLREILAGCAGAVAQGQLANDLLLEMPDLPVAVDLYDPWLVENLHYTKTLGLDPYRNDHATWVLQMSRADFFLCSSEEQRAYYLGFLTALGRVNPERVAVDADLQGLIAAVPFGVPESLPAHQPVLPPRAAGERRILFGGLYDWYDPWPLLEAFAALDQPEWRLLLIRNPNPEATPQRLFGEVEAWCRSRGLWGKSVVTLDWVPAERRYDLLREVDLLAATHRMGLEARLSLRTRFLDAAAAGCPMIATEGGTIARLLREHGAGWVVPAGDSAALGEALRQAFAGDHLAERRRGCRSLATEFAWERVLEPLLRFCLAPKVDSTKGRFAQGFATRAPQDSLGFRARRFLRSPLRGAR